jgi:hypothetical protein
VASFPDEYAPSRRPALSLLLERLARLELERLVRDTRPVIRSEVAGARYRQLISPVAARRSGETDE